LIPLYCLAIAVLKKQELEPAMMPPAVMPLVAKPNFYVITMDSPEGQARMLRRNGVQFEKDMGFEAKVAHGYKTTEIPADFITKLQGRYTVNKGSIACALWSHYQVWKQIVSSNTAAVIAEDDSCKVSGRVMPDLGSLADNTICRFGGAVRSPGSWSKEAHDFVHNMKFYEVVMNFKDGFNTISPDTCRFTCALAYWCPVKCAKSLISMVETQGIRRSPDIMLNLSGLATMLFYPPPYVESPGSVSQCGSPKNDLILACN